MVEENQSSDIRRVSEVRLRDGVVLEGRLSPMAPNSLPSITAVAMKGQGIYIEQVHRTDLAGGMSIPLANVVFVPFCSISFIIIEE